MMPQVPSLGFARVCYISIMFIECAGPRIRLVRPRTFAGLMTMYAANFVSLRQLLGDLRKIPAALMSYSPTDLRIYLTVCARSRYTTRLHMNYWPNGIVDGCVNPDLEVRIYHDARLVEAASGCGRAIHAQPDVHAASHQSELVRRWTLNVLLCKWLEHCLHHQHHFGEVQAGAQ